MAILQYDPPSVFLSLFDHVFRDRALALSEGDGLNGFVHRVGEGIQAGKGVAAGGKHKDQGRKRWRVLVDQTEVESRRIDEFRPHLIAHVRLHCTHQLVRPDWPDYYQFLEHRKGPREFLILRLNRIVDPLPLWQLFLENVVKVLEVLELRKPTDFRPHFVRNPGLLRLGWKFLIQADPSC